MSVNLSAEQLRQPASEDQVAVVLEETGLDSAAGVAPPTVLERLRHLRVGLIVDDFGKAGSSFFSVNRLPVDKLKIGRGLIGDPGRDGEGGVRLVSALTDVARAVGIRSVAKGVETAGQVRRLRGVGCDLAQGCYFWRPMTGDAATGILDAKRLFARPRAGRARAGR